MDGLALFLCMTAGVGWASSGMAAQHFFTQCELSAMDLTVFRMTTTSLLMLALTVYRGRFRKNMAVMKKEPRLWAELLFYGVVALMAMQYTYFQAIDLGNAAVVTVLQYTCPAMVICWLALSNRKWPDKGSVIAVVLAITGTFFLATGGQVDKLSMTAECFYYTMASAVFYAVAAVYPKHLQRKMDNSFLLFWGMLIGGISASFLTDDFSYFNFFHWNLAFDLFVIIFCGTAVAFVCYNAGLARLSADQASITTTVEPVASVILSYFIFGQTFGLAETLGIVMIVVAIAMPALFRKKSE